MSSDAGPREHLQAPPTLLQGAETLDLYLGVIWRNMETLNAELGLLRAALAERRELESGIDSGCS